MSSRPFIIVLSVLLSATHSLRAEVAHFDHEMAYIAALRNRGLYRLAEMQCSELASTPQLSATQGVRLNVELTKILTSRALNSRQPQRDECWGRATELLKNEIGTTQDPSSRVLLQLQLGLTMLEQAAWSRRECEIRAATDADWLPTRALIRSAINQLKQVHESLSKLKRLSAGRDYSLSLIEQAELERNTNYALARAYRNQAISYATPNAADASPDQISALTQALKYLQPLASDVVVDDVVWKSRVERIECYRLRGQLETAQRLILEANAQETPEDITAMLAAEGVRLALAANKLDTALRFIREHGESRQPELALARVETLVAIAKQKGAAEGEPYRVEAAEVAARLEREHGTYWGMRGEILIARLSQRLTANSAANGNGNGNATSLLETTANTLLKQARPDEAIETFLRAASQAQRDDRPDAAFDFLYKAAVVHQQEGQLQSAIEQFRDAAIKYSNNPRASETHLQAIFNGATLYQQYVKDGRAVEAKNKLAKYDELLQEHLRKWPGHPTADQARIWYGRLAEAQGKNLDALEAYQGVTLNSTHALESYQRLEQLYSRLFARNVTVAGEIHLSDARSWFNDRLQLEEDREVVRLLSTALVKLAFLAPPDYELARATLDRANQAGIRDKSLRVLQLVSIAGTDSARAKSELEALLPLDGDALMSMLGGLQPIRDAKPKDEGLRSLVLDCVRLLRPHSNKLTDAERLLVEQFVADTMLPVEALTAYRKLAADHPSHRRIQLRYAELASLGRDRAARDEAIQQWRTIVSRSKPRSPEWFRAKLGVAQSYFDKGDHDKSKQMIELLMTLYPDLGGAELSQRFQELLQRIEKNAY